jgi:hypothetical protein
MRCQMTLCLEAKKKEEPSHGDVRPRERYFSKGYRDDEGACSVSPSGFLVGRAISIVCFLRRIVCECGMQVCLACEERAQENLLRAIVHCIVHDARSQTLGRWR